MLLTKEACYGLVAVRYLARHARKRALSATDLARLYDFPHEMLAKILQRLARAGVLLSHHGMLGGYVLARDTRKISVLEVIKASEGSQNSVRKHHDSSDKQNAHDSLLRSANDSIEKVLHRISVRDIDLKFRNRV
jgi:Rrf2 family protein